MNRKHSANSQNYQAMFDHFLIFHQFRYHSPKAWEEFLLSLGLDWKRKRDDLAVLSGCQFHRGGNWSSSASAVGSVGRVAQYLNQWIWETFHQMKLDSAQQTLSNRNEIFKQHIMRIASTKSEENHKNIQEPMDTFLMSQICWATKHEEDFILDQTQSFPGWNLVLGICLLSGVYFPNLQGETATRWQVANPFPKP